MTMTKTAKLVERWWKLHDAFHCNVREGGREFKDEKDRLHELGAAIELCAETADHLEALERALKEIAAMPGEENEWDAVEKYDIARIISRKALAALENTDAE